MADSDRWQQFEFRPDDIVITTPTKCGTTWMQTIVGMLLFGRVNLGSPVNQISPWLDAQIRDSEEIFNRLKAQNHRRFIKTHLPLDGIPPHESITYIAVIRHPLDAALSRHNHDQNIDFERATELRESAVGGYVPRGDPKAPTEDLGDYLRWFIDNDREPNGAGPLGLKDYCHQINTYWAARHKPNLHLFHYADLWNDLETQMRRVAAVLGIEIDEEIFPELLAAARLNSMRSRGGEIAPEADLGLWNSVDDFFQEGGRRDWASILTADDLAHFDKRLDELAPEAKSWVLGDEIAQR